MNTETQDALNFIANNVGMARHALGHFLEAMKTGYANTPAKGTIAEMPGSKTIEYRHGKWRVFDAYLVTPQSAYSGGSTIIWYGPVPIWMMQYLGHYDKEAIPCLKAALKENYQAGKFRGGRGPEWFVNDGYTYINVVEHNNFSNHSWGKEAIYGPDGKMAGYHRYQSIYMVK